MPSSTEVWAGEVRAPVLAIETSCDETAAAVMDEGFRLLSDVVFSQEATHAPYGGVVPELASREHLRRLPGVVRAAIERSGVEPRSIAVTTEPGLAGCLFIGVSFARALGYAKGIPVSPVHHIAGHVASVFIERPDFTPPFLALVASGGHTELIEVHDFASRKTIARTRDDAAGEAFDKAARILGLGYPGGPAIEAEAALCKEIPPRLAGQVMADSDDFSFSGLKTALRVFASRSGADEGSRPRAALAFQNAVVETLVAKTARALDATGARRLALVGGVAANRAVRAGLANLATDHGVEFVVPSARYCTDNAAMIAAAALCFPEFAHLVR